MEETRTYTLRALEAKDVFIVSKIVSTIGIDKFKEAFQTEQVKALVSTDENAAATVGMSVFFFLAQVVLENLPKCEKDIYTFLSGLSGLDKKAVETLPMNTFVEMVIDVVKKEEFADFFKLVSKLFK